MSLKAGIVGLPNVGKSTLFNAITKKNIIAANYPFATIEPNVGIVMVPDKRMDFLVNMYEPKSIVPTSYEFIDIAGLVKGASSGEGLGNKFLSHIREVDAIVHVVRCFDNPEIIHVSGKVDPISDIEITDGHIKELDVSIGNTRNAMEQVSSGSNDTAAAVQKQLSMTENIQNKINDVTVGTDEIALSVKQTKNAIDREIIT